MIISPKFCKTQSNQNAKSCDAISFIRSSTMYLQQRFNWLRPLIDNVLNDDLEKKDVLEVLQKVLSPEENTFVTDNLTSRS